MITVRLLQLENKQNKSKMNMNCKLITNEYALYCTPDILRPVDKCQNNFVLAAV